MGKTNEESEQIQKEVQRKYTGCLELALSYISLRNKEVNVIL